jgi:multidrug resistance protein, MATE family
MVAAILPLVALFQVFDGLGAVTAGILRAQGKQVRGLRLGLSSSLTVDAVHWSDVEFEVRSVGMCTTISWAKIASCEQRLLRYR